VRYLPLGILMTALLAGLLLSVVQASHLPAAFTVLPMQPENYSNVQSLGEVLYTQYAYPFELAAVVLLVAIIATISLTFRGKRGDRKSQKIAAQIAVKPSERLEIIKMPTEKK
jgi:NADH-quinone oxidoreductase subunit J